MYVPCLFTRSIVHYSQKNKKKLCTLSGEGDFDASWTTVKELKKKYIGILNC